MIVNALRRCRLVETIVHNRMEEYKNRVLSKGRLTIIFHGACAYTFQLDIPPAKLHLNPMKGTYAQDSGSN